MVAKHLIISGRVQGVGFRYFSQETATRYHIKGWVRNLNDGTVELHAEGDARDYEIFKQALQDGNRFVGVEQIDETDVTSEGHRSFDIRY